MKQPSQGFVNSVIVVAIITFIFSVVPALQKWTLMVGGSLVVILILRYQRTGGQ